MPVQFDLSKSCCVAFNGLTDTTVPAVKLHGTLDFECRGIGGVSRYTNEDQPFLVGRRAIIDNLGATKRRMAVKYLLRRRSLVCYRPVVDCRVGDDTNSGVVYPCPVDDVFGAHVGFDLLLGLDVEYLECATGCVRTCRQEAR